MSMSDCDTSECPPGLGYLNNQAVLHRELRAGTEEGKAGEGPVTLSTYLGLAKEDRELT